MAAIGTTVVIAKRCPLTRALATVASLAFGSGVALAVDLEIAVDNVADSRGRVLVAICTPETFLGADCPFTGDGPAQAGTVTVTVKDIPPGTYAAQAFHDQNGNRTFDRNLIGIPREGVGFSNDAPIRLGPPSFEEAAITLNQSRMRTSFRLRYF